MPYCAGANWTDNWRLTLCTLMLFGHRWHHRHVRNIRNAMAWLHRYTHSNKIAHLTDIRPTASDCYLDATLRRCASTSTSQIRNCCIPCRALLHIITLHTTYFMRNCSRWPMYGVTYRDIFATLCCYHIILYTTIEWHTHATHGKLAMPTSIHGHWN